MCAIFGWWKPQFPAGFKQETLFRHLARKCQMNGDKSFGVFSSKGHKDGKNLEKFAGPASMWIEQNEKAVITKVGGQKIKSPSKLSIIASSDILIGHTRWPTQGTVNTTNCHPFKLGDWVACHNGCISNSKELMGRASLIAKGETDSEEALAFIVSKNWSKEALAKINGGYAFAGARVDLTKGVLVCDGYQRLNFAKMGTGYVWCTSADWLESSLVAAGFGDTRTVGIRALRNELLHLESGELEQLTVTSSYMNDDLITKLEGTRNGGRSSKKAGGDRFEHTPHYTSTPLDLSIGRRLREEANAETEIERFRREHQIEIEDVADSFEVKGGELIEPTTQVDHGEDDDAAGSEVLPS